MPKLLKKKYYKYFKIKYIINKYNFVIGFIKITLSPKGINNICDTSYINILL